jgi:hypothetical protein
MRNRQLQLAQAVKTLFQKGGRGAGCGVGTADALVLEYAVYPSHHNAAPLAVWRSFGIHHERLHPHTAGRRHRARARTSHLGTQTGLIKLKATLMNKSASIAFLIVGIMLLIFGVSAVESFSSDVSRFFTGTPTDRAIWLMIGGVLAGVIGLFGLLRGAR